MGGKGEEKERGSRFKYGKRQERSPEGQENEMKDVAHLNATR